MVPILRDAGLSALVAENAMIESVTQGFQFTEGPLWCPDGSILVQDIKAESTYRLRLGRPPEVVRTATHAANGQTFAADGRIIFCEQNGRRVSRMNRDGSGVETAAESWSGKRLNSPNDLVCRSDGLVYFTDPPYGVAPADRALHFQGVYLLDLDRTTAPPSGRRFREAQRPCVLARRDDALRLRHGALSRPRVFGRSGR